MSRHIVDVNATSNGTINTEDTFVELLLSGTAIKIKRVQVRLGGGTLATAGVDNDYEVRLVRKTAAGSGGVAATEVRKNQAMPVGTVAAIVKTGTTNFTTVTLGDLIEDVVKNGRETYEWIAKDEEDTIVTHPTTGSGGIFAVIISSAVVSQRFQVAVEWEE